MNHLGLGGEYPDLISSTTKKTLIFVFVFPYFA